VRTSLSRVLEPSKGEHWFPWPALEESCDRRAAFTLTANIEAIAAFDRKAANDILTENRMR
jgi:hypothetical protein